MMMMTRMMIMMVRRRMIMKMVVLPPGSGETSWTELAGRDGELTWTWTLSSKYLSNLNCTVLELLHWTVGELGHSSELARLLCRVRGELSKLPLSGENCGVRSWFCGSARF